MSETVTQFLTWAVRDVIFFSGDVQTTTIAVAITSSLCCSIIIAVFHIMAAMNPSQHRHKIKRSSQSGSYHSQNSSKKLCTSVMVSGGRVHVPCVKCGSFYADVGCRFVTCKLCCFSPRNCQIHHQYSAKSPSCQDNKETAIDLSKCGMQECPKRLGFIGAQLTCLNLSENNLNELPAEIGCLRGLQKLSLSRNSLSELPSTLGSLSKLTVFDLSYNTFTSMPDCTEHLVSLENLDVSHNALTCLSSATGNLSHLEELLIGNNKLESLCPELFNLIHLKCLHIQHNPLKQLPDTLGNLVQLRELDASSCDLTSLPVSIGKCSCLVSLKLDDNRLKSLPSHIGQLSQLQAFSADNNQLQYLPAMLTFLPETVAISVSGNPLFSHEDSAQFERSVKFCKGGFPPLTELTARVISQRNIPNTDRLPTLLQGMLKSCGCCSKCGGPFFSFFEGRIIHWHFLLGSSDQIPVYQQLCSPHQPLGCG